MSPICAAVIISLLPVTVCAQTSSANNEDSLEEVTVTGTRIKRPDYQSISPIVSIDAAEISLGGITNIEDLLNDLPQFAPGLDRTGNNPGNGAVELDLRGLGSNRTLVMINGRRAAPHSVFGAVNINTIPAALLKRAEVVTGGASTVYGSDAIAGAVNFILDTEFTGLQVSAQYDTFEEGDGEVKDVNVIFGVDGGRGHLSGFFNVQDRQAVLADDRQFSQVRLQENFSSPSGELIPSGSGAVPAGNIFFPPLTLPDGSVASPITFDEAGAPRQFNFIADNFNFQPDNYLQIPVERLMGGLFGNLEYGDNSNGFFELLVSNTKTATQLAAPPFFNFLAMNVDHPLLTAEQRDMLTQFDQDADGIAQFFIGRRLEEPGPRRVTADSDSVRAVVGLEGVLNNGWDWQLAYSYSETDKDTEFANGIRQSRLQQGLLVNPSTGACFDPSNGCVPLSLFGNGSIPAQALDFLRTSDIIDTETVEEQILTATVSGDVLSLPAGDLAMAAGVEWRDLASEVIPDPLLVEGDVLGYFPRSAVSGSFDVKEVFAESLIPLLEGKPGAQYLGLEAGVRFADYSLSGSATNWKLGLDWLATPSVRVRVMQQRATRAPNSDELFRQPREIFAQLFSADPCSASSDPVARGIGDVCIAQGLAPDQLGQFEANTQLPVSQVTDGGNTNLNPEEADTLTAGIVIQPTAIPDLSLSLDYFDIDVADAIGVVNSETTLVLCSASANPQDPFCQSVERGVDGNIARIFTPQRNLANSSAKGVDLAINWKRSLPAAMAVAGEAQLSLRVVATHTMESGRQESAIAPFVDCAGFYGGLCRVQGQSLLVPGDRADTRLTYSSGPLDVSLSWEWIGKLENHAPVTAELQPDNAYASELGDVNAQNYFDLSVRYDIGEHMEIRGGISNLLEESPPLLGFGATQSNTAPQLYDVFGRRFFLGFTYRL